LCNTLYHQNIESAYYILLHDFVDNLEKCLEIFTQFIDVLLLEYI